MIIIKEDDPAIAGIIKRVRQIAQEIDVDYIGEYDVMRLDTLAFRLKLLAINYSCYMQTETTIESMETLDTIGVVECGTTLEYNEEDEETWEKVQAWSEPIAIIVAFKWLADRGYFIPENRLC